MNEFSKIENREKGFVAWLSCNYFIPKKTALQYGSTLMRVQYMCVQLYTRVLCVQIVHTSVITKYFYLTNMGLRETEIS